MNDNGNKISTGGLNKLLRGAGLPDLDARWRLAKERGLVRSEAWSAARSEAVAELRAKGIPLPGDAPASATPAGAAVGQEPPVLELVPASTFAGKPSCSRVSEIEWAASHLMIENVEPADAPSAIAWGLLVQARREPRRFWEETFGQLLPPRGQVAQASESWGDDGRDVLQTVLKCESFAAEVRREAQQREAAMRAEIRAELLREGTLKGNRHADLT